MSERHATSLVPRPSTVPRPAARLSGTQRKASAARPPPVPARPRLVSLHSIDLETVEPAPVAVARPLPEKARRFADADLIGTIFEEMHALQFMGDALEAARYCLTMVNTLIPCKTSMVHMYDAARREFMVVSARGEGADDAVLKRQSARDPLLRVAMARDTAFTWNNLLSAPSASLARFATLGPVRRVMTAPVVLQGRYLGAIELIDPVDGEPFDASDEHAVTYVATQLASFLSTHGVIVDVGTVARFAFDAQGEPE